MARYVLDIPSELAEQMNERIRAGKYNSPQDFITVAIQNQVYLESREAIEATIQDSTASQPVLPQVRSVQTFGQDLSILVLPPNAEKVKTVPLGNVERPDYLWGQYNRFFPVKIVTRVAANLAGQHESEYVLLGELQEKSADIARDRGKMIERKDREMGRKRGTIISAGLPIGRDSEKAKSRFKNQFVGYMAGKRIEGAAPALKFLDMKKAEKNSVLVGITDFGLKFASLPNPLIDLEDFSAAFSAKEVEFLLDHIASEVPEEAKLMHLILAGVKDGIATPQGLNDRVKAHRPDWKGNEASMMRAGIVSRIGELGLLERQKEGVQVTYLLTELGEKYLERLRKPGP